MSLFSPIIGRARASLAGAEAAEAHAVAELVAHRKQPADPGDAAAIETWRERERRLAEKLEIARGVTVHWRGVVAEQEERAARDGLVAECKKLEAEAAGPATKRVKLIAAKAAELRALIDEDAEHLRRINDFNARRGDLPFLEDAEARVRSRVEPGRKAITERRTVWVDANGEPCSEWTYDASTMQQIRREGIRREDREFVVSPAMPDVRTMPERFADVMKLVDMQGRPL